MRGKTHASLDILVAEQIAVDRAPASRAARAARNKALFGER
jgi:hypothetical protein